LIMND